MLKSRPKPVVRDENDKPVLRHRKRSSLLSKSKPVSKVHDYSNEPFPKSRRRWSFWPIMIFMVVPVYSITFISWGYVVWWARLFVLRMMGSRDVVMHWYESVALTYALAEAAFSIYYQTLANIVRRSSSRVPPRDYHTWQLIFHRILQTGLAPDQSPTDPPGPQAPSQFVTQLDKDDPRAIEFRHHMRHWFGDVPWREVTRGSMATWLAFAIFDKDIPLLTPVQQTILNEAVDLVEKRCGTKLPEKRPSGLPEIKPLRVTLDPVNIISRPMILYVFYSIANTIAEWYARAFLGLTFKSHKGIDYLIRPASPSLNKDPNEPLPIVFFHGIGFGIFQYMFSIQQILKHSPPSQGILIPMKAHITQNIWHPHHLEPLPRAEWVEGLKDIIEMNRWDEKGVTVISHSKGSFTHSWLLKAYPELIARSALMDPVVFVLWEGDLCINFLYKTPETGTELIFRYFAGSEIGIANNFQRHLDWSANSLWMEDIPNYRDHYRTAFWIAGGDTVLDGSRVRHYIARHGVGAGLYYEPHTEHGEALLIPGEGRGLSQVIQWLNMPPPEQISASESDETDVESFASTPTLSERESCL